MPGVGRETNHRLAEKGIKTCEQLWDVGIDTLKNWLGPKTGETLGQACRGIDTSPLETTHERKSIGVDVNYGMRFTSMERSENFVSHLCNELASRMKKANVAFAENISVNILMRQRDAPVDPPKFLGTGRCDAHSKSINKTRRNDSVDVGQNLATYILPGQPYLLRSFYSSFQSIPESVVCVYY